MLNKLLAVISILLLVSCGGGGGGGGGSSPDARLYGARILHGAVEAAPIDLVSSLQGIVQTAKFGESAGFAEFQSGNHVLNLYRTKDLTSSLFTRQVTNSKNQKHTVLFYGDRADFGLRSTLISEEFPEVPDGVSFVRIIHATVGAGSLQASLPSSTIVAGFGSASTYATATPGPLSFSILRVSDKTRVDGVSFVAQEGKAYTIFVAGEVGYLVLTKVIEEN